jgi:hypothetical protein
MTSIRTKAFVGIFLGAFILVSFLGIAKADTSIEMNGQIGQGNCFIPGMAEMLCQMNPLEHIAAWQSMFTAVPSQGDTILLLAFLLALALGAPVLTYRYPALQRAISVSQQKLFLYFKQRIPIVHPLQEALSGGILNPKICDTARI